MVREWITVKPGEYVESTGREGLMARLDAGAVLCLWDSGGNTAVMVHAQGTGPEQCELLLNALRAIKQRKRAPENLRVKILWGRDSISTVGHPLISLLERYGLRAEAEARAQAQGAPQEVRFFPEDQEIRFRNWAGASDWLGRSLVVIGSSTGGIEAIQCVLSQLPKETPPVLIVQHMPAGFTASFAHRLNEMFEFSVKEAVDLEVLRPGTVYIAPGGRHMEVRERRAEVFIELTDAPPRNRFKPSVDFLFESVARIPSRFVVAAVLTGMGSDGARGMLALRQAGAVTIAQDQDSSVVFGMPGKAISIGAAEHVCALDEIGPRISKALTRFRLSGGVARLSRRGNR